MSSVRILTTVQPYGWWQPFWRSHMEGELLYLWIAPLPCIFRAIDLDKNVITCSKKKSFAELEKWNKNQEV